MLNILPDKLKCASQILYDPSSYCSFEVSTICSISANIIGGICTEVKRGQGGKNKGVLLRQSAQWKGRYVTDKKKKYEIDVVVEVEWCQCKIGEQVKIEVVLVCNGKRYDGWDLFRFCNSLNLVAVENAMNLLMWLFVNSKAVCTGAVQNAGAAGSCAE